ncbi:uncharacterized protein SAMN05192534_101104 [Alteribacillus persepolensis]|uniref:DUF177 domain-containing protein n=1 Tax=Alteribacillus persepolensis TaxID=568899 RepID=A0A1G7YE61_9BACI|nr:YceD family protein [Alteribacillus persepolensis]SDG94663.1 uncharacterized protein SAMN05192534_101104 [Alteribacillus persepolensis]
MRWSVQQLLAKRHEGLTLDDQVDVSELIDRDREIRDITSVTVKGNVTFTGETAAFDLRLQGSMILPCARTLADVHFPFDIETTERFRLDGMPVDEEDVSLHEPEEGYVDLLPYIKENILLELPIQVFAEDIDEKDAPAPQKGKDWAVVSQKELETQKSEEQTNVDPRMADLAKFFDKDKN